MFCPRIATTKSMRLQVTTSVRLSAYGQTRDHHNCQQPGACRKAKEEGESRDSGEAVATKLRQKG
eukprot:scaffold16232_cov25-Tisochrysis_lutea.AAC.2